MTGFIAQSGDQRTGLRQRSPTEVALHGQCQLCQPASIGNGFDSPKATDIGLKKKRNIETALYAIIMYAAEGEIRNYSKFVFLVILDERRRT